MNFFGRYLRGLFLLDRENLRLTKGYVLFLRTDRFVAVKILQQGTERTQVLATGRTVFRVIGNHRPASLAPHYGFLSGRF